MITAIRSNGTPQNPLTGLDLLMDQPDMAGEDADIARRIWIQIITPDPQLRLLTYSSTIPSFDEARQMLQAYLARAKFYKMTRKTRSG